MSENTSGRHTAGAFDIRNIIGLLLSIYGVLLVGASMLGHGASEKTGGINANLWCGLGLLVVGAAFITWARLRPIVVPDHIEADPDLPPMHH